MCVCVIMSNMPEAGEPTMWPQPSVSFEKCFSRDMAFFILFTILMPVKVMLSISGGFSCSP